MQQQISNLEKALYNKHLAVSRSIRNKPFKIKKDFSNGVSPDKEKSLKRIANLIKKHPEIDLDVFFSAPYKLYPDVEYFNLEYFSTLRAIKAYTMYKQMVFLQNPETQTKEIKKSLRYIANFCVEKQIYFHQYPYHKTADIYTWMIHFKENKINIYAMMEFKDLYSMVTQLAEDIQTMFVKDFVANFKKIYLEYNNSPKTRSFLLKAYEIMNNFVQQELTNSKNIRQS